MKISNPYLCFYHCQISVKKYKYTLKKHIFHKRYVHFRKMCNVTAHVQTSDIIMKITALAVH